MSISASSPDLVRDPLNSPFPLPWQWILDTQAAVTAGKHPGKELYRSPSLYDPQHRFTAYCRVRLDLKPAMHDSRITSTLFVENLETGVLNTVIARSPLAPHPFQNGDIVDAPGIISLIMPVSWSTDGKKLLSRQFEGFLGSCDISDFGVIWDSETEETLTLSPSANVEYTHAILLGWCEHHPEQILFQAGSIGEDNWQNWAVALDGKTSSAVDDAGVVFGEINSNIWSGSNTKFNI
ncbi:hypothetical protein Lepto7376_1454 [[Leptolyngbya] sp. PCC 7376]|uniref:hypothetical protein n=1 Tax=[Leptolyngbya] sp. PCC 7376 TaxID=111781 RepID=UPI00029F0283|nr:hypothetical protein [[Leptolyngbya] sp. PCC 7376]AFY37798.1 hypothetical protein Lepto7376_1454 [[Leptolyngbya] sp. PCC 7376]